MEKITNIRQRINNIEKDAKKLHEKVFQAFKEVANEKDIDYEVHLKNDYFYSIACGVYNLGFFPYKIFYNDGKIELWRMKFGEINYKVAEWKTVEEFKRNFSSYIEN